MDSISLYRKYRPQNFDNLIGQEHIKTTLSNAFKSGQTSHAYLFTGPRGTGKTSTARLVAKALNCTNLKDGFEPCDECEFCTAINSGSLIDVIEIDAASNRGIDEIRDLKEKINYSPTRSKYKVYIIDEVHMMTKEAFNALLKTLEEPPAHVYFVLATTEIHKIPETIISRCQRFDFRRITSQDLIKRLQFIADKEGVAVEDGSLEIIARYVNGGMRDAIGLLEQLTVNKKIELSSAGEVLGVAGAGVLGEFFTKVWEGKAGEAIHMVSEVYSQGSDLKHFRSEFIELLREKMIEAVGKKETVETAKLLTLIENFQAADSYFEATIPQLPLEIAIIKSISGPVSAPILAAEQPVALAEPVVVSAPPAAAQRDHKNLEVSEPVSPVAPAQSVAPVAPVVPPVPAAATPEVSAAEPVAAGNLGEVMAQWPRVLEGVKTPMVRMSVKTGTPVSFVNGELEIQFSSDFHLSKVKQNESLGEVEAAAERVFGTRIKVKPTLKGVAMAPVVDESLSEAMKIFGGELTN